MFTYQVFDFNFNHVGQIMGWTPEDALAKAKLRYPHVVAPMVSQ